MDAPSKVAIMALLAPGRRRACFLNAHCVNIARKDSAYRAAIGTAKYRLPDGVGIELAARMDGLHLAENLNGTDFIPKLLEKAAKMGKSVFLLGAKPGTAQLAAHRLQNDIPGLQIAGTANGYGDMSNEAALITRINESNADILLVALGVPHQETWLARHAQALTPSLLMGVGAFFDFYAGNVRRAPKPVRTAKLEWVWRLAMEPRRMARRYLLGNMTFLVGSFMRSRLLPSKMRIARRAMDLAISGGALLALSPVFLTLTALIKLDSKGPAFFSQTRIGKDGQPFQVLKFRSMHTDAEKRRTALLAHSERDGICFKHKNDPRITRMGKLLRRASLDELPQLINVLRGDMSIVGPRPALPSEVAQYPKRALKRLSVKPGITGIWQVSGRADIGFDKMIDMDLAYTRSHSILLDIILICLTFRAVITGRGAY
ncbi:polymer biosynthesis protein, WecB/TagA/CpsF family [Aliiroseovarius halocynthiae]|nr:WecB/TagA/CpsF family glycosyltransferase [Aliiroseovarius halocynthiae]SMR72749.1 polymer biosynthesis protein, WecB/TagA/CpsF family [Aliiroseovarius halocynthiae]